MRDIFYFFGFYLISKDRSVVGLMDSSPLGAFLAVLTISRKLKGVMSVFKQSRFSSLFTFIIGSRFSLAYLIFYRAICDFPNTVNVLCLTGDKVELNFFIFVVNFAGGVLILLSLSLVGFGNISSVATGDDSFNGFLSLTGVLTFF